MSLNPLRESVVRGAAAGGIAGGVFGLFLAVVMGPLLRHAETFEHGHGHEHEPLVAGLTTTIVSTTGGVVFGLLLGVAVFGVGYYLLAPALPDGRWTSSYLVGLAGFITVSGAPWLVLPPQPPGVTTSLGTTPRIGWYVALMVVGALACVLAGTIAHRLSGARITRWITGVLAAVTVLAGAVAVAPTISVSGPIPESVATQFRLVTIAGQLGLWFVLASSHAWLRGRPFQRRPPHARDTPHQPTE